MTIESKAPGARFVEPILAGTLFPAAVRRDTLVRSSPTISEVICAACY
jgi:hypothetical protein